MSFLSGVWTTLKTPAGMAASGLLVAGVGLTNVQAQTEAVTQLTGTLAKARNAGTVVIGYRES